MKGSGRDSSTYSKPQKTGDAVKKIQETLINKFMKHKTNADSGDPHKQMSHNRRVLEWGG